MRRNYIKFILIVVGSCALVWGCGAIKNAKPAADRGVTEFHDLFNDEKFQEIYDASDSEFKAAATAEKMNELLAAINRKLGRVRSSENQTWNVSNFNLTTRAVLAQKTEFEQGSGVETFTFKIDGDKAVLLGYYINSSDLITK